mmetsp:Transcript_8898/g.10174  ORF Transcript_8898/g.10174 Transcript_8898/m.10174 type:complete len:477 (+) Transcript_8898:223-1653(+)
MFWEESLDSSLLIIPEGDDIHQHLPAGQIPQQILTPNPRDNVAEKGQTEDSTQMKSTPVQEMSEEKRAKRRAAVAAASRATRAKKKRQLEELRDQHIRLTQEREDFLSTIADLQMNVMALRESGSIDLRLENDLLRAELQEHKQFIGQLRRVVDGLPTTHLGKRVLMLRGADTATSQTLGLLSTSMFDPTWNPGKIVRFPQIRMHYQRLPHGSIYQNAKRVTFRVDLPFVPVKAEDFAEVIWSVWEESDLAERLNKHFHKGVSVDIKELDIGLGEEFNTPKGTFLNKEAQKIDGNEGENETTRGRIKACYYRETRPSKRRTKKKEDDAVVDTVLVLSGKETEVPLSSFPSDPSFNEGEVERTNQKGTVPAIVLSSTSTQHSKDIEPLQKGVYRVQSAAIEGYVFRRAPGGCFCTSIYSLPVNMGKGKSLSVSAADGIITDRGCFTTAWEQAIQEMISIVGDNSPGVLSLFSTEKAT